MTDEHFQKWWQKVGVVLAAIIFWSVALVLVIGLFKACSTAEGPRCPPGMVWVQDPGSPFGDGDCEEP